jgi:hypothetical protein
MRPLRYFILGGKDDHEPVESDLLSAAQWMDEGQNNLVAQEEFGDDVLVSTIFLGLDHNYGLGSDKRPTLFETMIFGEGLGEELHEAQWRCATWDEAVAQHRAAIEMVQAALARQR